ncbi:MAG: D-alanyl-D-alanine carboxypeptidase family protein [Erythrobacter sp.]|nr:D-alanyl-D-alanine carboxypeptidase family protein [Erythrobacter sp.]
MRALPNCLLVFCITVCALFAPARALAESELPPTYPSAPEEVVAPIVLLVDISSGQVLYSRNADRRFIPASITKAMTTFAAFELMEAGTLRPGQTMTISDDTWREWNGKGSTMWLSADRPVRVEDLLTGIANVSANDASIVLAEGAMGSVDNWTALMNEKASELGMSQSHFATPNGWPDDGRTFTTAHDLVVLAKALIGRHPKKFAHYLGKREFSWNGVAQTNYDPLLGRVDGADGIKTGYTNESGFGFLGTARRGSQRLVMVIAGADRLGVRARASRALMEWGFDAFDRKRLFEKGATVGRARVQAGNARGVDLTTDRQISVNVPKGKAGGMTMAIRYSGPVRAPIAAGQKIATLEVRVPDMAPARIPLVAASNIEPAGFFSRIFNGIAGWFS